MTPSNRFPSRTAYHLHCKVCPLALAQPWLRQTVSSAASNLRCWAMLWCGCWPEIKRKHGWCIVRTARRRAFGAQLEHSRVGGRRRLRLASAAVTCTPASTATSGVWRLWQELETGTAAVWPRWMLHSSGALACASTGCGAAAAPCGQSRGVSEAPLSGVPCSCVVQWLLPQWSRGSAATRPKQLSPLQPPKRPRVFVPPCCLLLWCRPLPPVHNSGVCFHQWCCSVHLCNALLLPSWGNNRVLHRSA